MSVESTLTSHGFKLPEAAAPVANYVPAVISGSLLFISGQLCLDQGVVQAAHKGKLGGAVSVEAGQAAARLCAINLLAQAKATLGDLGRIKRCVRLGGFINATPDFGPLPQVMNGASNLMVLALGDKGHHARTTIGVAQLPLDAAVEVEAVFEIA